VFGESIALSVHALTKNDNLDSKEEKMSNQLKLASLKLPTVLQTFNNLQFTGVQEKYYSQEKLISEQLSGKNKYLNERLKLKIEEYSNYFK
jgi:hypothetical protein